MASYRIFRAEAYDTTTLTLLEEEFDDIRKARRKARKLTKEEKEEYHDWADVFYVGTIERV